MKTNRLTSELSALAQDNGYQGSDDPSIDFAAVYRCAEELEDARIDRRRMRARIASPAAAALFFCTLVAIPVVGELLGRADRLRTQQHEITLYLDSVFQQDDFVERITGSVADHYASREAMDLPRRESSW